MEDPKSEKVALFRYGLIATLVLEKLSRGELVHRARELASLHYEIPFSERSSVSVGTLLIWARRYRKGGIDALGLKPRKDRGHSRVISPPLAQLIERLKRENPYRAGTTLLKELALSKRRRALRRAVKTAANRTRRMSIAARRAASQRMKRYWAERRKAQAKVK